jgi:hypothetical protein
MPQQRKIAIIVGIILLLAAVVGFTIHKKNEGVVTVQTGKSTSGKRSTPSSSSRPRIVVVSWYTDTGSVWASFRTHPAKTEMTPTSPTASFR